jgi:hypothetical protein
VSLMVGSDSTNTLASFTISATNNSTDRYTVFFGLTSAPATGTTGALFSYTGFASTAGTSRLLRTWRSQGWPVPEMPESLGMEEMRKIAPTEPVGV